MSDATQVEAKDALSFPKSEIKVILMEKISQEAVTIFRKEGYSVECYDKLSEDELVEKLPTVHVLGVRSKTMVTKRMLDASRRLLAVGCFCIGTDQTDLDTAARLGKAVFNAPFANTRSVAEMVIAETVMLMRQIGDRNAECHKGKWAKVATGCWEVRGKVLGIVGYGHVGSQVSVLAEGMGMVVRFFDHIPKLALGNAAAVDSLDELLAVSDVLTLHVPLTNETANMIGKAELAKMKKGSYLINAARGQVLDQQALADAITAKHIAGAAVDVYSDEPASNADELKSPLRGLSNVILTPHIGGSTEEAQGAIGKEVANKIINFINTGATLGAVNVPEMFLPQPKGTHRIMNFHKNIPGVLRDINQQLSAYNVRGQMLMTLGAVGYLIVDVDQDVGENVKLGISALPASIKTRIAYS